MKKATRSKQLNMESYLKRAVVFIKFVEKERIESFLKKGELHFGKLDVYRQMAMVGLSKNPDTKIGDLNEDTWHEFFGPGTEMDFRFKKEMHRSSLQDGESATFRQDPLHPDAAAFCLIKLTANDFFVENENCKINLSVIQELEKDFPPQKYEVVVFTNINLLSLSISYKAPKSYVISTDVEYNDSTRRGVNRLINKLSYKGKATDLIPFVKYLRYKNQHEFRFLLEDSSELDKSNNLFVGPLREHTSVLSNLREVALSSWEMNGYISRLQLFDSLSYHFAGDRMKLFNNKLTNSRRA